jgi:hypothetical protein
VTVEKDSTTEPIDAGATFAGVVVSLLGGGSLFWGCVVFAFYGICEDSCDKPPRTVAGAFHVAAPWALSAVVLMAAAAYLFMSARPSRRPTLSRAVIVGVTSSAVFVGGLWLLALGTFWRSESATLFILGMITLVCLWQTSTIVVARRVARRR